MRCFGLGCEGVWYCWQGHHGDVGRFSSPCVGACARAGGVGGAGIAGQAGPDLTLPSQESPSLRPQGQPRRRVVACDGTKAAGVAGVSATPAQPGLVAHTTRRPNRDGLRWSAGLQGAPVRCSVWELDWLLTLVKAPNNCRIWPSGGEYGRGGAILGDQPRRSVQRSRRLN